MDLVEILPPTWMLFLTFVISTISTLKTSPNFSISELLLFQRAGKINMVIPSVRMAKKLPIASMPCLIITQRLALGITMPKQGVLENVIVSKKLFLEVVELAPVTQNHVLEIRKKNFLTRKFTISSYFFRNSSINTRPQTTPRTRHSSNERACFILLESSYKKLRKVTGWSKNRFESR